MNEERIITDDAGLLDEVYALGAGAQIERLDDGLWFVELTRADGSRVAVMLRSTSMISAAWEVRR